MKKILSAIVILAVMLSSVVFAASADGTMYFIADFTDDATFSKDFYPEAFGADSGEIFGYSDARALQSTGSWAAYDTEFSFSPAIDDLYTGEERSLSFVYINGNLEHLGLQDGSVNMSVYFDIINDEIVLVAGGFTCGDDTVDLAAPVAFDFEDEKYYTFGVSITEGRIRVFNEGTLLIDYVDANNEYYIGHSFADYDPSILLWWNTGNFVKFSDIKVSSPAYLYPMADNTPVVTTTAGGENNVTTENNKGEENAVTTTKETTTRVETSVVVKDNGETEIVTEVITEAPSTAATNTGKPAGGSSTSTGDATFAVVAAMVATLGCAIIVKKVNA